MVHCIDIAGRVGCVMGQVNPGGDGMRRHHQAPHRDAPIEKSHLPENAAYSYFGGKKRSRLFMMAVPSVHAVCVETLGPMKR